LGLRLFYWQSDVAVEGKVDVCKAEVDAIEEAMLDVVIIAVLVLLEVTAQCPRWH
jgi:hypothetical protein